MQQPSQTPQPLCGKLWDHITAAMMLLKWCPWAAEVSPAAEVSLHTGTSSGAGCRLQLSPQQKQHTEALNRRGNCWGNS